MFRNVIEGVFFMELVRESVYNKKSKRDIGGIFYGTAVFYKLNYFILASVFFEKHTHRPGKGEDD